jgi:hypothetical protein
MATCPRHIFSEAHKLSVTGLAEPLVDENEVSTFTLTFVGTVESISASTTECASNSAAEAQTATSG